MRALTTITAILLVGSALSSCDQPKIRAKAGEQDSQTTAATTVAAAMTTPHCNCPQTAAANAPVKETHAKGDVSDAQENPYENERGASEVNEAAESSRESAPPMAPMSARHMWPEHHEYYRHYHQYAESQPAPEPYTVPPRSYYRPARHATRAPVPTAGLVRYDQYLARHEQSYGAQYTQHHAYSDTSYSGSNTSYSGPMTPAPQSTHNADYYNGLMLQYLGKHNHNYVPPGNMHAYQQSSSMNQQYTAPMPNRPMPAYSPYNMQSSQQSIDSRDGYGVVVHQGGTSSRRYDTSVSTGSVDAYNYMSSSSVSYSSGSGQGAASGITWVDGYGRGYFAGQKPTVAKTMRGIRLEPYHAYGVDCPDQD